MKAFKKRDLYVLKAAIKGFAAEAQHIRQKDILPNTHEARQRGWARKRSLGLHARFHQLAYAFMLGKKYSALEKGRPLAENYWQTNSAATEILNICKLYGGYRVQWCKELTKDAIIQWFKTDENIFTWELASKKVSSAKTIAERLGFKKKKAV
jgi:hypothetical protein